MKVPSKLKFQKYHQVKFRSRARFNYGCILSGGFGLQAVSRHRIFPMHVEAGRRAIRRASRTWGNIKVNAHAIGCVTKKATLARMGKGKGAVQGWYFPSKIGSILYEFRETNRKHRVKKGVGCWTLKLQSVFAVAAKKLPCKTRVSRVMF